MKNYYEILEVNEKASQEIISKVFKMHIKKWHPDLYQGEEKIEAENKTKEINEAYTVLSDENKRAAYDAELLAEKSTSSADNYELEMLREENAMLKKGIQKRDMIINNLIHPSSETSKRMHYYNDEAYEDEYEEPQTSNNYYENNSQYVNNNQYGNNNYSQPVQNNTYEPSIKDNIKDFIIKITVCFFILLAGSIIIFFLIKNLPLLKLFTK